MSVDVTKSSQPMDVARAGDEPVLVIEPSRGLGGATFRELWRYRELLGFLVWRDVKVRYKQTTLGMAWAILQPMATMVVFTLVFARMANMSTDGVPGPVFFYAGLLPWTFFANAVTQASMSLVNQSHLLTKIYFPRMLVPASTIGAAAVDFALSGVVYLALMAWYGIVPGVSIVMFPVLAGLVAAAAMGFGLTLAAVTVTYRDFRFVVPFLVQLGLFVSPVIYPASLVTGSWRTLLMLNPMAGIIEAMRAVLLNRAIPWPMLNASVAVIVVMLVVGWISFRRMERLFADIA